MRWVRRKNQAGTKYEDHWVCKTKYFDLHIGYTDSRVKMPDTYPSFTGWYGYIAYDEKHHGVNWPYHIILPEDYCKSKEQTKLRLVHFARCVRKYMVDRERRVIK
jgi:hypothetical protein